MRKDFKRQHFVSGLLGASLELDNKVKKSFQAEMPTMNFVNPSSLFGWLNMKRLVQDID
jgi:hypothetical protein